MNYGTELTKRSGFTGSDLWQCETFLLAVAGNANALHQNCSSIRIITAYVQFVHTRVEAMTKI